MKLYKLHEAKTLREMVGGIDMPMNASPTPQGQTQDQGLDEFKKKLDELDKGQKNLSAAMTQPGMNPAVPVANNMQMTAAKNMGQPAAPTSNTAAAALNPTQPTTESDVRAGQSNTAGANAVKTNTF
jgi:hypothetical protein